MEAQMNGHLNGHSNGPLASQRSGQAADGNGTPKPMPVAIVGMSCRLSGNVSTLDDFWEMMTRSRNGWSEIPPERFNKDAYYHPNAAKKGAFNTKGGYFLKQDPALFDAPFFNITQAEAEAMDPQQRMLLECTYEAIENAGIPKECLIGRKVGVFIGGAESDYRLGALRDLEQTPMFTATGNHQSLMSGRISHYFDLRGPSFTIDTACSSSLYALHQAVQSIRCGESEQAIVAACHLNLQPGDWVSMSLSRLFSDQGMTYAFDSRARSGFARGEGVGSLILKPLDQAIRDNDKIHSVVVNTGVNQDGRTVGITSPSGKAQEQLMREVYADAGISPEEAGFVEAHGTGTKVGDPIEATAIHNVFGAGRTSRQPLYIGSVKSNVGHLENASGVISVIKAAMMLEKGFILPNTNFETPNESIPFAEWNLKVPVTQRPWPAKKKYISVNNFGFGGSNAHCVLAKPPLHGKQGQPSAPVKEGVQRLFTLSANDEGAARRSMQQLSIFLERHPEVFQKGLLRNLAYTLCQRRSQLQWRVGLVATSASELAEACSSPDTKPSRGSQAPRIAFVYTGQGAQWYAMGRELLESHPIFADTIQAADECLRCLGADFSLREELSRDKDSSQVGRAHISQPICSAIQLGLTELLKSWGVTPTCVTGHSSGEIGAAYAAGALTLESAMAIAYYRGQAVITMKQKYPELRGSMMAVGASPETIRPLTKMLKNGTVVVACENSPTSVTASGDEAAIDELAAEMEARQTFNRKLRVDVAYHSPHMELVAEDYYAAIKQTKPAVKDEASFYSSVRGKKVDLSTLDASYWVDNLTCPVRFSTSLRELCTDCHPDAIVEIGPHAALEGPVKQILKAIGQRASKVAYFSALRRNENATTTALKLAADLYMKGQPLEFAAINLESPLAELPAVLPDMAPYPWSQQRYWSESCISQQHRKKPFPRHDLLGTMADFSNELAPIWRNVIRTDDIPWLRDHKMQSLITFPFAGFVAMAVEAAAQRATLRGVEFQRFSLREIQVKRPLLMDDGAEYELMLSMAPYAEGTRAYSDDWDDFHIWSWEQGKGWTEHCRGAIAVRKGDGSNPVNSRHQTIPSRRYRNAQRLCQEEISSEAFYHELDSKGATYGPTFRKLGAIRANAEHSLAEVEIPDTAATMPMEHETSYVIHPTLLDQILQLSFPILGVGRSGMSTLYMPNAIKELQLQPTTSCTPGQKLYVAGHGCPDLTRPKATDFSMEALQSPTAEQPLIRLAGLVMTPVKSTGSAVNVPRKLCYKLQWEPVNKPTDDSDSVDSKAEAINGVNNANDTKATEFVSHASAPITVINGSNHDQPAVNNLNNNTMSHFPVFQPERECRPVAVISDDLEDPIVKALKECLCNRTGTEPGMYTILNAPDPEGLRLIICELKTPLLSSLTSKRFSQVRKLLTQSAGALWVTSGAYLNATNPTCNMALGLTRTIRSETAARTATLDLDPESQLHDVSRAELIWQTFELVFDREEDANDMEYAEKDGVLVVPRIVDDEVMNLQVDREVSASAPYMQDFNQGSRRLKVEIGTKGALDSLYFVDDEPGDLGEQEIEIQVKATGMNFKDVVIGMGQLPSPYIGIECAGIVSRIGIGVQRLAVGERVCAMSEGAYSHFTRCPATSAAKIPADMSFELAASIPVVYCTAYYGLVELAHLEDGERVLIHAAAGGVGQAALHLAKMMRAEIFATVGSAEKKKFIMDTYGIPEDHILSSRDTSFGPAIRELTGGAGVDVVINSLAGELLRETWECVAHFGRFVEIGKRDIVANSRLEMSKFDCNATFSSVDLTVLARERPKHMARTFKKVMNLFETGFLPLSPVTVLGISEVEKGFRLLQSGKTTGKLVVVPRAGERVKAVHPKNDIVLRADASYIIVGGTGGLGRCMTRWMVEKGARTIVLLSRSGRVEGPVAELVQDLRNTAGANIVVKACDVADAVSVTRVIEDCTQQLPPIAGAVHAGMVLRDVLFEKMSFEDYEAVIRSKVAGGWNIHNALLSTPLDFFIVISSAAGIVGNRGQAAYAAANTFLDALAQYRLRLGLPAASIDLAAVADVGYLADNADRQQEVTKNLGGETMTGAEVMALVGSAIRGSMRQPCNNHCLTGLKLGGEDVTPDKLPFFASDAKFEHLRSTVVSLSSSAASAAQVSISTAVSRAESREAAVDIITDGLTAKLAAILMIPAEDLEPRVPITKYGLDSLNAIELRNWITKELGANLQVLELLTAGSLVNLAELVLKKRPAAKTK